LDVTPIVPEGLQVIDSYGPGRFRVAGAVRQGAILVWPERCEGWTVTAMADLSVDTLSPLFEADPAIEVLLIGCGVRMEMVSSAFKQECRNRGIGVDAMDTGAACRTYNVLLAEGRRVAAALIPLSE
jgi:uncharacterized protein